jgi:hypothetical protein
MRLDFLIHCLPGAMGKYLHTQLWGSTIVAGNAIILVLILARIVEASIGLKPRTSKSTLRRTHVGVYTTPLYCLLHLDVKLWMAF